MTARNDDTRHRPIDRPGAVGRARLLLHGPEPLHRRTWTLRWIAAAVLLALAALHQLVLHWLLPWVPPASHFWLAVALYGLSGCLVAWLAIDWFARNAARQAQTEARLHDAYDSLAETHRQLLAVHDIGREIASAEDMQQVLELAARAPVHLAGAQGSAVITFDDEGDQLKLDIAWGLSDSYLRGLRQRMEAGVPAGRCRGCDHLTARVSGDWPLFAGLQDLAHQEGIQSLICLPINHHQKREGIISAYFPSPDGPPEEQVQLLNIVAMPRMDGVEATRRISAAQPGTRDGWRFPSTRVRSAETASDRVRC